MNWAEPTLPAAGSGSSAGNLAVEAQSPSRHGLFRKYVLLFIALVGIALIGNSALDFWFSYQENKAALVRVQQEKADAAARSIEEFIGEIERQIGWTTHAQWAAGTLDQRKFDYIRLLRQVPAITELSELDGDGKEQLKVSRLAMDVVGSDEDFSFAPAFTQAKAHGTWFSPVYFRKESEPYMTLAIARAGRNAGVTVAEINLKLIWDVITTLKIGQGGYAYVADGHGRLIAHPDISLVLRDTDLSHLPQVAAALAPASRATSTPGAVTVAKSLGGRSVLTAHAAISPPGWLVFVEVPLSEAFAPLYGAAWRSGLVLALGLLAATLAALVLARRMTGPIRALQAGAARIGAGELDRRIEIRTGDELEGLADQFNRMGADLQKSYAELEQKVEERTADLSEALVQQTATAEVLQVINSSPGDLAPVFDAMLERARRLCRADSGIFWIRDGDQFRAAAASAIPAAFTDFLQTPVIPGPTTALARIIAQRYMMHQSADMRQGDAYRSRDALAVATVELGGFCSIVAMPLVKDGELLGSLSLYRREVQPFTDKEVAPLPGFAAQAVIAMENARLLTETREARDDAEVALRDLKAAQANLIQAEKMASLGQLTAGIAHEIKNPLNFVNNFANLSVELLDELKETTAPVVAALGEDERAEIDETIAMLTSNLEKISEHGRRADGIVKSMLEHSRGGTGERRSVDLNGLIEEALNLAYHGARAQDQGFNITLERDFGTSVAPIELVPQDITRVCLNLFGNGFYAANKRHRSDEPGFQPVLKVTTRDLGDAVEVRVRDNGSGIPVEIKDKLFQPFFTTKPTGEGTGLGLSISYDIVTQQHGGTIKVESRVGEYTEFTIRLPRDSQAASTGAAA